MEKTARCASGTTTPAGSARSINVTRPHVSVGTVCARSAGVDALEVQGVGHAQPNGSADLAFVLGRCRERLLKGYRFVAKRELERLARPAIGRSKHHGETVGNAFADAGDEARVRPGDGGLLDLELRSYGAARTDERDVVQPLLATEIEFLRDARRARRAYRRAPRPRGGRGPRRHERSRRRANAAPRALQAHLARYAREASPYTRRGAGGSDRARGLPRARAGELEERRQLGILLCGLVERRTQTGHGIVGERELAARIDVDSILVSDGLTRRAHHAANAV